MPDGFRAVNAIKSFSVGATIAGKMSAKVESSGFNAATLNNKPSCKRSTLRRSWRISSQEKVDMHHALTSIVCMLPPGSTRRGVVLKTRCVRTTTQDERRTAPEL